MASLAPAFNQAFPEAPAGRLHCYESGTTTPKTAYQDQAGLVPHVLPTAGVPLSGITLDAGGRPPGGFFLGSGEYTLHVYTAAGALVKSWDDVGAGDFSILADLASTSDAAKGDALIGVKQTLTDAVGTTQHKYNRRIVSCEDFGALGDGSVGTAAMLTALTVAWTSALAADHDLYFPPGTYDTGTSNMPWRQSGSPVSLLDCGNVTLWCAGPATIFKTTGANGADVFQLNGLKNFHVRGFPTITATISGSVSGSNGVSVTAGWDNITLEVFCLNLASLDKGTHVDGGKALTLQPSTTVNECGSIKATVLAKGCAEGFGIEPDLVTSAGKRSAIDIDLIAEDCFYAMKFSAGAASGALTTAMTSGLRIKAHAINCQKDVVLNRMHGGDVDVHVVTTKSAAARRLNPSGVAWFASDTFVEALWCTYAHNARISVRGNKGACDHKARIGGTTAGSSGLIGATDDSDITLDIGGTAATANVLDVDSGGNTLRYSRLACSVRTATTLPDAFYAAALRNDLQIGTVNVGEFTGSLTGCTTVPTGTVKWSLNDDVVVLEIPSISGTSNTTAATITGMPVNIRPTTAQSCVGVTVDNGAAGLGRIVVETSGVITLYVAASVTFTAASTKGTQFSTITFRRT